jgi:hypothetical protein
MGLSEALPRGAMDDNRLWRRTPKGEWQYQAEDGDWYRGGPWRAYWSFARTKYWRPPHLRPWILPILLAVVVIVAIMIARSIGTGFTFTYRASVRDVAAIDTQRIAVTVQVTNTGSSSGTPICWIVSPFLKNDGISPVSPSRRIPAGQTRTFVSTVAISHNRANNVVKSDVNVICV